MMSWSEIKSSWSSNWKSLYDQTLAQYQAVIESDPSKYLKAVQGMLRELSLSSARLARIQVLLQHPNARQEDLDAYNALVSRHRTLSAGIYADASPAGDQKIEGAPLLIVGGLIVGVAAIAWSIAAYEYAVNMREQTELMDRELTERVKASKQGRKLQPSTVQPPDAQGAGKRRWLGWMVLGGAGLATAAAAVPILWGRR